MPVLLNQRPFILAGLLFFQFSCVLAQGTSEDYQRAKEIRTTYPDALKSSSFKYQWCDPGLIFERTVAGQKKYSRIDGTSAETMTMSEGEKKGRLENFFQLPPRGSWSKSGGQQIPVMLTFQNTFDRPVRIFWVQRDGKLKNYGHIPAGERRSKDRTVNGTSASVAVAKGSPRVRSTTAERQFTASQTRQKASGSRESHRSTGGSATTAQTFSQSHSLA